MPRFAGTPVEQDTPKPRFGGQSVPPPIVRQGMLLPVSTDAEGGKHLDFDAGIIGAARRAFSLPEEVYRGQIDPQSPEGIARTVEMAGMVTPASTAAKAGERMVPGVARALTREAVPAPSIAELRAASKAGYDAVRDSGVDYKSEAVRDVSAALQRALEQDGILDSLAPKTFNVLGRLQAVPEGSVAPIAGVEAARRAFGKAGRDFTNPTEQEAARRAVAGLDKFVAAADPATVVSGPAEQAGSLLQAARGNHAAAKRSEALQGIERAADVRSAAANSGQNTDNAVRQRLASLLLSQKQIAGFDASERQAIERVVRGETGANTARAIGNVLGGGGGLGMGLSGAGGAALGSAAGGPLGAAVGGVILPATGAGLKKIATVLTKRGLDKVDDAVRSRSPLFKAAQDAAPMVATSAEKRAALARLLLGQSFGEAPQRGRYYPSKADYWKGVADGRY